MTARKKTEKNYPSIAMLEISNIADGIATADAIVKKSPILMIKSGTVSKGKFLILFGGTTAAVDEAFSEGLSSAGDGLLASVILYDIHPAVFSAIEGKRNVCDGDALLIFDTPDVADILKIADAAVKGAEVDLVELRLADQYGGRGYLLLSGKLEEAQAAREIGCSAIPQNEKMIKTRIISLLSNDVARGIDGGLRFNAASPLILPDGETPNETR